MRRTVLIGRDSREFTNEPAVTGGNPVIANNKVMLNDMLGNSIGAYDKEYQAIDRTAFGETTAKSDIDFFTGKPNVEGLGYNFLYRNYRPEIGKWQTQDPISLANKLPYWNDFCKPNIDLSKTLFIVVEPSFKIFDNSDELHSIGYPDGVNNLAYASNKVTQCFDDLGTETIEYTYTQINYQGPGYSVSYYNYLLLRELPTCYSPGEKMRLNGILYTVVSSTPYSLIDTDPTPKVGYDVYITKVLKAVDYVLKE